jgi:hypothetical protein
MKKALALTTAGLLIMAALPAQAQTQDRGPQAGDWEATLSGSGTSDNDDSDSLGVTGTIGKYMTDNVLLGLRQSGNFSDTADDTTFTGATRIFGDVMLTDGPLQPFIGASLGGIYGEGVNNSFTAGPEAGLKYYADRKTFLYAQTEYQFTFQDSDAIDDAYDDGGWFHSIGIGFNF